VVRLIHGDYHQVTVYADDPVEAARSWVDQGAALVHVVDLVGAKTGEPDEGLWAAMTAAGVPYQVGGGLRTAASARRALDAGAARVVMGTAAVWEPGILSAVGDAGRVVAAVDVRGERATGAGWLDEGRAFGEVVDGLADAGCARMLVTGIGRDGTMEGPDLALLGSAVADGRLAVIASGGVGTLDDIRATRAVGCEGVIVGRALYEGRFTVAEALASV
jgi:phosphoribosylformimino-5-aminoimidazole carboxamide ribotide isomerase